MLDRDTKRKIDSARQILVGKVPDPKAQVEQITTALIYKFMDDMDLENEDMGLTSQFFIDDYSKYSWRKLMDNRLSGQERLDLYVQAITNMTKNPHIPQLFRDIFKGAFLPFRDPRTLSLFLKEINQFSYDNSENLGNAFEYLLSILGSQGDAGQFRTPRHIIDFIVEAVNPKKNETILDPACGTAGFLISAYKHILKINSSNFNCEEDKAEDKIIKGDTATETIIEEKINYSGDLLSPVDKTKLIKNIEGYDISPDMVKLALVNLYLHGFSDPKIFEYDTLSDDKRWNKMFDVIFANPPFMTPRGGIKPHKKFSINANRAEVLFVDYIGEHLNINGCAGIIVPEGIIFQATNAYKNLRKNLIENWGLYAVVSLPSGVFQPYSGVKTSILLMDKKFAKKSNEILFLKVENDGFDLGAQRRKINKNDLPKALKILKKWKKNKTVPENSKIVFKVGKEIISKNGDYNLTGNRYLEKIDYSNAKWPMVKLVELIEEKIERVKKQNIQVWSVSNAQGFVNTTEYFEKKVASKNISNYKIINSNYFAYNPSRINVGSIALNKSEKIGCVSPMYVVFEISSERLNAEYLFKILKSKEIEKEIRLKSQGAVRKQLRYKDLITIKIPLLPLEVQEQIVEEIKQFQKVIDGAKQVVESWKPSFRIDPSWEMVELGEVCEVKSGGTPKRQVNEYWNGDIPWVGSTVCKDKLVYEAKEFITESGLNKSSAKLFEINTTLIALVGATIGKTGLLKFKSTTNQNIAGLFPKNSAILNPIYLYYACQTLYDEFSRLGDFKMANLSFVKSRKIPLPTLEVQEQIVEEIEAEQEIVNANKELIEKMEKKIEMKVNEVWEDNVKS